MGETNPDLKIALLEQALKHEAEMRGMIESANRLARDLQTKEYESKLGNQKAEYHGLEKRVSLLERQIWLLVGGLAVLEVVLRVLVGK